MAITIQGLASKILTSIHGRRLGIDPDGFLVGSKPIRHQVSNATSDTTGTNIPNNGFHTVSTTTNDTWTLTDPVAGCEVTIQTATTSTGNHVVVPADATIVSTNGVAGSSVIMQGVGAGITLRGISTSQWILTSRTGSTTAGATVVVSS